MECATEHERSTGIYSASSQFPVCAARAFDLLSEVGEENKREARLHTINKGRICVRFVEWEPAYDLKDHMEMFHQAELARQQSERDRQQREFQERQAADSRKHNNRSLAVSLAAVAVAASIGIANIITTLATKTPSPPAIQAAPQQQIPSELRSEIAWQFISRASAAPNSRLRTIRPERRSTARRAADPSLCRSRPANLFTALPLMIGQSHRQRRQRLFIAPFAGASKSSGFP